MRSKSRRRERRRKYKRRRTILWDHCASTNGAKLETWHGKTGAFKIEVIDMTTQTSSLRWDSSVWVQITRVGSFPHACFDLRAYCCRNLRQNLAASELIGGFGCAAYRKFFVADNAALRRRGKKWDNHTHVPQLKKKSHYSL